MTVAKGRLNWGVFFIVLGAVPLAFNQGAVTQSQITDAWRLWPLIIVGIGVGFILSRTPAYFAGGLIVAATIGLIFGSLLAVGPNIGCRLGNGTGQTASRTGSFDGPSTVHLDLQCGSATITTSTDGQWHVDADNDAGRAPSITAGGNDLTVNSGIEDGDWLRRGKDAWRIALPSTSPIDLTATMDFGEARYDLNGATLGSATFTMNLGSLKLDLSNAHVHQLNVETNLGAASIELGTTDVSGDLKTSLGSLKLCVPADLGLQLRSNASLSATNLSALHMHLTNGLWETENFSTAEHKAIFTADTSLGSLELQTAGGCK